jgi:hypothetical protein
MWCAILMFWLRKYTSTYRTTNINNIHVVWLTHIRNKSKPTSMPDNMLWGGLANRVDKSLEVILAVIGLHARISCGHGIGVSRCLNCCLTLSLSLVGDVGCRFARIHFKFVCGFSPWAPEQ